LYRNPADVSIRRLRARVAVAGLEYTVVAVTCSLLVQRALWASVNAAAHVVTPLRTWYGHDPERFAGFVRRYLAELKEPEQAAAPARTVEQERGVG